MQASARGGRSSSTGTAGSTSCRPSGTNLVVEVDDGEIREWELDPRALGIYPTSPDDLRGGDARGNADAVHRVIAGERSGRRDAVLLNAAGAIVAAGLAESIGEGVEVAAAAIDSGGAAETLERLVGILERGGARLMGRFADALRAPGLGAIAEIKRRSPSAGDLRPDADPARIAPAYASAGAAAISVLVDERFAGSWDDLRAARTATDAPLLAKGFFSSAEDLRTAKEAGADAVLLLLRDLDDETVVALLGEAEGLALDTLVEAHDAAELERGIEVGAPVLGVNARDLATFEIDRNSTARAPRPASPTTAS